jgi:hypothetical protein
MALPIWQSSDAIFLLMYDRSTTQISAASLAIWTELKSWSMR